MIGALVRWISRTSENIAQDRKMGAVRSIYELYTAFIRKAVSQTDSYETIFDREWDLLIVLDACRHDLFNSEMSKFGFADEAGTYISPGSSSEEWMEANFTSTNADEMLRTAYVTGNAYSDAYVDSEDFAILDEVWRYSWDEDMRTIPARPITDRTIKIARESNPDRIIVHYMQPHAPFVTHPKLGTGDNVESVWEQLLVGRVSKEIVWEAYRDNLRYVLEDVELLLENIESDRAIITSDHGNAFGELGIYGHPYQVDLDVLKRVPWCETTATDTGSHNPEEWREETQLPENRAAELDGIVDERLTDLGYK